MSTEPDTPLFLSVVLPTHNPNRSVLVRVLEALQHQTLPTPAWELLVVDNASDTPVSSWVDLTWHNAAQVLQEETLGLTPARFRGIRACRGDLIILVDDDNILDKDYLNLALSIAKAKPFLGAFGGSIEPEFESPPAAWTKNHWGMIAIRPCDKSVWTNDIDSWIACPSGAGMCVRKEVALQYYQRCQSDPVRTALDRRGESLISGGDVDIVYTGLSMGYGMGRFAELKLIHIIPAVRLSECYLMRMYEAKGYSGVLVNALWRRGGSGVSDQGLKNLASAGWLALMRELKFIRFRRAQRRGVRRAMQRIGELKREGKWKDTPSAGAPG